MDCGADGSSSPSAAQAQLLVVEELRKELEHERLLRRRAEAASRALARELAEERQASGRLEEELERKRAEAARAEREMEEERRMLQMAELWREERVQIKLLEAKVAMEEKLQQMTMNATASDGQRRAAMKVKGNDGNCQCGGQAKKEVENPHIRRGIRGHVEFSKVVRTATQHKSGGGGGWKGAISSESKLECQRAQLRVLMRHKNVNEGAFGTSVDFVS